MLRRDLASSLHALGVEEDDSSGGVFPFDDDDALELDDEIELANPPNSAAGPNVGPQTEVLVRQLLQAELDLDDEEDTTGQIDDPITNTALVDEATALDEVTDLSVTGAAMLELIECCDRAGTPINFLDNFVRVLKNHSRLGFDIQKAPKRSTFMAQLRKNLSSPNAIPTLTKSRLVVLKYSFLDQLKDLLSTSYAQDVASCTVNADPSIRWHKYIPLEEEGLSEVACASWYQRTYDEKIGDDLYHVDGATGMNNVDDTSTDQRC